MVRVKFPFSCDGSGFTIWGWKGDYITLGAGAELAIYRGDSGHRTVDKSLAMRMSMVVKYKGDTIISYTPHDPQWWLTAFNPNFQNVDAHDLSVRILVEFRSLPMMKAFMNKNSKEPQWSFREWVGIGILTF